MSCQITTVLLSDNLFESFQSEIIDHKFPFISQINLTIINDAVDGHQFPY